MLNGDCLTVTGKTIAQNLKDVAKLDSNQDIIMPLEKPIKDSGHIGILYGNIASTGSVAKSLEKGFILKV